MTPSEQRRRADYIEALIGFRTVLSQITLDDTLDARVKHNANSLLGMLPGLQNALTNPLRKD